MCSSMKVNGGAGARGEEQPGAGTTDPVGALDEPADAQDHDDHDGDDHAQAKPQDEGSRHAVEAKPSGRADGLSTLQCESGVDLEADGCRAAASRAFTRRIATRSSPSSMRPVRDASIPVTWRAVFFPPE
jgi:hypothetical protein